ncbi:MAG: hypothetical protein AAF694_23900 [Bacteroidota bacterium]
MKVVNTIILLMLFTSYAAFQALSQNPSHAQADPEVLIGTWKLDMTPQNSSDENWAMMRVKKVSDKGFQGTFYREGVKIREGKLNTQTGTLYGALISGDNSGEYNSTFYYKEGKLYGSTHAVDREFLSVWTATKESY